jgi:alpha-1,2-mannosyltransferase
MPLPDALVQRMKRLRHGQARAFVLLVILWALPISIGVIGASLRGVSASKESADFAHFYTLGHLARQHQVSTLYDATALRQAHIDLVPSSAAHVFPPVYPPQVALLFAPFSIVSYEHALLAWNALTAVLYAVIVWTTWKRVSDRLANRAMVFTAAAAFPPVWSLLLTGQNTIIILAAVWAGWLALERGRPLLAGIAFGLLAIKPQFGIPFAVIVLAGREWSMLGGAVASVAVQACAVWLVLGWQAFEGFARTLPLTFGQYQVLESKPFMNHSLRSLTQLAPAWLATPLFVALVVAVLWCTARVWRSGAPLRVRLGVVIVASGLVNPHFQIYDVTILALPLLWLGAFMQEPVRHGRSEWYWKAVFWLFAALFIQSAINKPLYVSILLMMGLFALVVRETLADERARHSSYATRAA